MFATIDELSDAPVTVTVEGVRVRIRYGRGATLSLDLGEAVDLLDALATALAQISGLSVTAESDVREAL